MKTVRIAALVLLVVAGAAFGVTEVALGGHDVGPICSVPIDPNVTFLEKPAVRNGKVTMMWEVDEPTSFRNGYNADHTAWESTACRLITSRLERDEGSGWVEVKSKPVRNYTSITRGSFRDRSMPPNAKYDYRVVIVRGVEVEGAITTTAGIGNYVSEAVSVFNYVPTTPRDFEAHGNDHGVDLVWVGDCDAPYYTVRWEGMGQPYTAANNSVVIDVNPLENVFCSQRYEIRSPEFTLAEFTFYKFMISTCPVVSFAPGELACDYARNWTYAWTTTDTWIDRP